MPLSLFKILGPPLPTRGLTHAILRKLSGLTIVSESFEVDAKDHSFLVYFHIVSYYCRVVFYSYFLHVGWTKKVCFTTVKLLLLLYRFTQYTCFLA